MELKLGLLLLLCLHTALPFGFDDIETIFDITEKTVSTLSKAPEIAELVNHANKDSEIKLPFSKTRRQLIPMFKKFAEVTRIVKKIDRDLIASNMQTISQLQKDLPIAFRFELKLDAIEDTITLIELYYQNFLSYTDQAQEHFKESNQIDSNTQTSTSQPAPNIKFDKYTLENFATSLTSHVPTSVRGLMERINEMIVPSSRDTVRIFMREGIFQTVVKTFNELEGSICSTEMSPQQLIYNLYSTLQVTQVKAYVMMQFSWTLLHLYGKGNFTTETELLQAQFKERLVQQMGTVQAAMSSTSNMVYKCDPKTHIQGQTYTQLTMLLQGYLVNVVDLNGEASCRSECAAYSLVPRQYDCYKNEFCARQKRCEGTILNCQFYDSDMTLCASPKSANSTRRYEWIQYENGVTLGKKSHCLTFEDTVDSWWRFYIPPHHCTYCMCLCDAKDNPRSDRYWSLRPVESDISNNKIMVGIRFIKLNKVVHLQIRQATLLPKLLTNTSTAEWIPVNPMDVSDRRTVEGLDFHKMTFEKRALDLDDLKVTKKNHVITGIRFRLLGSHLNLEVRATQFDYETGQLFVHKSFWFGNSNTDANMENPRTLLNVDNLDVPTVSSAPSRIDSVPDSYLLFTNSDLDRDVGQTTLPYIDIQPVTTEPLSPLSGAGVYHKSMPGYGGYVAPRLFTYDASEFLSPDIFRSKK